VFFCVVVYGLFHGLIVLPVVLSLFGPSSSCNDDRKKASVSNDAIVASGVDKAAYEKSVKTPNREAHLLGKLAEKLGIEVFYTSSSRHFLFSSTLDYRYDCISGKKRSELRQCNILNE
jgi:hypothetical protein